MSDARHHRGIAMVETAIVLPLLMLIFLAVGELGRVFIQYTRLVHRVQVAARHVAENALSGTTGVVPNPLPVQLVNEARNLVIYGVPVATGTPVVPGLAPGNITVSPDSVRADMVEVRVTYAYQPLVGALLPAFGFGNAIALNAITLRPQTKQRVL